MQKMFVMAVRDRALDAYLQPFFVPAVGLATRQFADEVNKQDSPMYSHSEDYDLYQLGTWDAESGQFTSDAPRMISVGKDQKRPE